LQRFSPVLFLFSYFIILISRLRLARFSFFNIFFSADNMFAAAFVIFIRLAASQITIDGSETFFPLLKGRKLFLNGHKVDKTVPRLRYGWY
jgi:hypothetical protein